MTIEKNNSFRRNDGQFGFGPTKNHLDDPIEGCARRGTHQYANDFALPRGFLFVLRGIEKNNKTPFYI